MYVVYFIIMILAAPCFAAEVTNVIVAQEGNRVALTFDLEPTHPPFEKGGQGGIQEETDIYMAATIGGTTYTVDQLHL